MEKQNHLMDMYGNIKAMGRNKCTPNLYDNFEVKDLRLVDGGNGKWAVYSNNRQLTNVRF